MPAKDPNRWTQNEDGSWSRHYSNGETVVSDDTEGNLITVLNDYSGMTKAELEDELESRGLTKTGNKDELIARLTEDDNT